MYVIDEAALLIADVRAAIAALESDVGALRAMLRRSAGMLFRDAVDHETLALARAVMRYAHVTAREALLRAFRYHLGDAP